MTGRRFRPATLGFVLASVLAPPLLPGELGGETQAQRAKKEPTSPAAPTQGDARVTRERKGKEQVFDFTGLRLQGSVRTPQLLYFLDRAEEELQRAALERRSFIPALIRSVDEEAL